MSYGERFHDGNDGCHALIGDSPAMVALRRYIAKIGPRKSAVLIYGESGTGKELVAQALHRCSGRAQDELIALNCAALPEHLAESELFGYERGSFTGAATRHRGYFEQAHKKTLFLDEIGELSLSLQPKLLRVLQEGEIRRVGAEQSTNVDVRIIAATNRDLKAAIKDGRLREDLYYRLKKLLIRVPPLRERRADILPLARHFVSKYATENDLTAPAISSDAEAILQNYHWPGNVREVEDVMGQAVEAVELVGGDVIRPEHLPEDVFSYNLVPIESGVLPTMGKFLQQQKRAYAEYVVKVAGFARAAEILGIHPKAIYDFLRRLDLGHLLP